MLVVQGTGYDNKNYLRIQTDNRKEKKVLYLEDSPKFLGYYARKFTGTILV
jgi:hypothetical protein